MNTPMNDPARERHWACAQRMRERRLALGLTQRQVVGRLQQRGTRITNRALSVMENGRGPDVGLLPELAGSLDCTVTYLLGLAADPQSWRPDQWTCAGDRLPPYGATARRNVPDAAGPENANGFAAPGRFQRNGAPTEATRRKPR